MAALERKLGKYAVKNLMLIVVGAMAIVFVMDMMIFSVAGISVIERLSFNREALLRGEVWRIITFIFIPPNTSIIFIIFSLYFYYMIGSALENEWGAFRFNMFYLCGIIGTIISGMITGIAVNDFLNMSLFLAFAAFYPEFEVRMFFLIPIKMKYLAYVDIALILYMFYLSGWSGRAAILASVVNLLIFFGKDMAFAVSRTFRKIVYKIKNRP
jgi:Predicted membrane protein